MLKDGAAVKREFNRDVIIRIGEYEIKMIRLRFALNNVMSVKPLSNRKRGDDELTV